MGSSRSFLDKWRCITESIEHVSGDSRNVVVVVVIAKAPAPRHRAYRKDRPAMAGFKENHLSARQRSVGINYRMSVYHLFNGIEHAGAMLLRARHDDCLGRSAMIGIRFIDLLSGGSAFENTEIPNDVAFHSLQDEGGAALPYVRYQAI